MNKPNPELRLAEEFVRHTNCHIYLTGKAGTGKTTFLHHIRQKTRKRSVVTAPTGVAAINAGGVTLHAFFQIPFGLYIPGSRTHAGQHQIRREKKNLIRSLDLLIIHHRIKGIGNSLAKRIGPELIAMVGDYRRAHSIAAETPSEAPTAGPPPQAAEKTYPAKSKQPPVHKPNRKRRNCPGRFGDPLSRSRKDRRE